MTDNPDRYYRSAGAVPMLGIVLMMAAGSIAALVCGAVYAAADWYIAYDIVPFLCAPIAGAGIGAAVRLGATAGGARHRGFLFLVGLAMGFLGAYLSWVVFLRLLPNVGVWIVNPQILVLAIDLISEQGVWDNQPTGIWLKMIYTVETLSIMGFAGGVAALESRPFCEHCNGWTEEVPPTAILTPTAHETLREKLEDSRYEALDELFDPAVDRSNCLHAKLIKCPRCNESNYLVVSHVRIVEKKGETQQSEDKFIKYLWVPEDVRDQLVRLDETLRLSRAIDETTATLDVDAADEPEDPA